MFNIPLLKYHRRDSVFSCCFLMINQINQNQQVENNNFVKIVFDRRLICLIESCDEK